MNKGVIYREPRVPSPLLHFLERPRLDKTLALALQNPVAMVVAGQGFGKTSAVYSYLRNNSIVSLWLQLTDRDNISGRFWENLCSGLILRNPQLGNALLELGFPETNRQFDRFYIMVEQAIRDFASSPPREFASTSTSPGAEPRYVLVYDDFHLIHNSAVLRFFNRVLAFPFFNITMVIISRTEPEIKTLPPLSKGFLSRITVEDLRFTPEEMAGYFTMQGLKVSREDLESFWQDTEGWPQVISLVVQDTIRQKKTEIRYSPELVKIPLFKMIENSFFSSLDRNTRLFLIKLSLGEHWSLELLDRLDGAVGKKDRLDKISPLIRYDSFLNGYHIHNLLIEFLKEKQGELSAEERREVYRKNAEWCLENNQRLDAAIYYEKAGDYGGILHLCFTFPIVLPGGIASFFLSIIERIPAGEETDEEGPGNSSMGLNRREVILYLRYPTRARLLFAMGRFDEAAEICRQAIDKFEKQSTGSFNDRILTPLYFCLGFTRVFACRRTGDYNFFPYFEKACQYYDAQVMLVSKYFNQGFVSIYICQVGPSAGKDDFEEFLRAYARSAPLIMKTGGGHHSGLDSLGRCEYCYFKDDPKNAEKYARQAIIQARGSGQQETENRGLFFLLRIALYTGNFSEIEDLFGQLKAQIENLDYQNRYILYDLECAWFYAQTGDVSPVAPWLRGDFEAEGVNNILRPLENLVRAKCFYAEKRYRAALSMLNTGDKLNGLDSYLLGKLEKTALEALCWLGLGERRTALKKLGEARKTSETYGLDMPFVELGEDMRILASLALNGGEEPESGSLLRDREWLESVRKRAAAYGKMSAGAVAHGPITAEPSKNQRSFLRRREEAVLYALSQGFTREEVAHRERLSLNAVKEIIKNIYQKLGAVNRADAVRIAADLGILKKTSH